MARRSRWNALACSLLLTACAGAPPAAPGAADGSGGTASVRRATPAATAVLEGRVTAPANVLGGAKLIGLDGASLVGADGASLVGADGASLIGQDGASLRAGRGVLAVAERGLAGAEVVLADAKGKPLPGVKPATTDADGRFKLVGAPAGAFRLQAGVRTARGVARLEAMVRPDVRAAGAEVSAASTLVARLVAAAPKAAAMDMARWSEAVEACAQALDDGMLPDWGDPAGVDRAAKAAMARSAAMRPVIAAIARDTGMDLDAMVAPPAPSTVPAASPVAASPVPSASAASTAPAAAPSAPASPTPAPVATVEYHDPRVEFRKTEAEASAWTYYWLDGPVPRPMTALAANASWVGGTETRPDDLVGYCTVFLEGPSFVLDPSTTKLEGAAAAWTTPVAGTARVVGYVDMNAHTTNGATFSVRNGDVEVAKKVLGPALTVDRFDTGNFQVPAGGKIWLWAQPNAMPETTDLVRCQLRIEFTRSSP